MLKTAGFDVVGRYEISEVHDWSIESLFVLVYSTSLLPLAALGDHRAAFEADLRDRLLAIEPSGVFREHASFAYDLARRGLGQ